MGRQKIKQQFSEFFQHSLPKNVDYEKKYEIAIQEGIKILVILRSIRVDKKKNYTRKVVAFTVALIALYEEKWIWVRKHCWMQHSEEFHTHIRTGIGRKRKRTIQNGWCKTMEKAIAWSKNDMVKNWIAYTGQFQRKVRK